MQGILLRPPQGLVNLLPIFNLVEKWADLRANPGG
jgi:hypothetical protein